VVRAKPIREGEVCIYDLEAVEAGRITQLSVASPPDILVPMPNQELQFDPAGFEPYGEWVRLHQAFLAGLIDESGTLAGARFGRVALEPYQCAPALRLINKPRPSLLIADDVGLGKTIEAGLALLELMARGRAGRVLVVAPPGLLRQWQEEMDEKFGLKFVLIENAAGLAREQGELPAGMSPWDVLPRVLTSVDFIKKETVRNRALRKKWDLIIADEAHALAEAGTPRNPYRTQRTRLGTALRDSTRGLILLTATPHNGYPHSFRSLIELVEPTAATLHGDEAAVIRRIERARIRRLKPQITRKNKAGKQEPVFPPRTIEGMPVKLADDELGLLNRIASYCSKTARQAAETDAADIVSFAMQIIKKRALSSRAALVSTIEHRLNALKQAEEAESVTREEVRELQLALPLDEASAERAAVRLIRSVIPREEKQRKGEIRLLNGIKKLLTGIKRPDPKLSALVAELLALRKQGEKVIVFTEYLDTLGAIRELLDVTPALRGRYVVLRGGMAPRQRTKVQDQFETDAISILLATDAASEGLNLQRSCHHLIHIELPWNPNRLEQRNGRIDRYGQTQPPQIRYLFYPDSPEDDILDQLIRKIERMQQDRVSTPDILGMLAGLEEIDHGLVELDPEAADLDRRKQALVRIFDDRTAEFIGSSRIFTLTSQDDPNAMIGALARSQTLLKDDESLERLLVSVLGRDAMRKTETAGIYRIEVPLRFRGPGVLTVYPAVTFRRAIAVKHRRAELEFITPLHPLVIAAATAARQRLLLVYPDDGGRPARRLAARRVGKAEAPSILFTFLGGIIGSDGVIEERLLAVRVAADQKEIGDPAANLALLASDQAPGEVAADELEKQFKGRFAALAASAREYAKQHLAARAEVVRRDRQAMVAELRADIDRYLKDRLLEIDEEERRAKGLEEKDGQLRLFGAGAEVATGYKARREAVKAQVELRCQELDAFSQVNDPEPPQPLGALCLVPE